MLNALTNHASTADLVTTLAGNRRQLPRRQPGVQLHASLCSPGPRPFCLPSLPTACVLGEALQGNQTVSSFCSDRKPALSPTDHCTANEGPQSLANVSLELPSPKTWCLSAGCVLHECWERRNTGRSIGSRRLCQLERRPRSLSTDSPTGHHVPSIKSPI